MPIIRKSPYLKPNRLATVLTLIQTMGLNERYREKLETWTFLAFGEPGRETETREVFEEHPEFFRDSPSFEGQFSLVARRVMPRRWDTRTHSVIDEPAHAKLDKDTRDTKITRLRLDAAQMNKLMDVAVTLHDAAVDARRDSRWWVIAILPVVTALAGAIVGALLKS